MDVKGKLVEVVHNARMNALWHNAQKPDEYITDMLMEDGVTVQEWISVKDRLPDTIPCDAGTAYSEAVNVLTSGRKVLTAIWDGTDFITDAEFCEAEDEEITHWTPVLLPLPPKGE